MLKKRREMHVTKRKHILVYMNTRYKKAIKWYLIKYLKNRNMNISSLIIPRDC